MARVVVHPPEPRAAEPATDEQRKLTEDADGYREKLAKYVPAEAVAFLAVASSVDTRGDLWLVFVIGLLATPIALFGYAMTIGEARRPRWYFYALSLLAYIAWAIGSNTKIADLFGASDERGRIIMAAAAVFIPAIDEGMTWWIDKRRAAQQEAPTAGLPEQGEMASG